MDGAETLKKQLLASCPSLRDPSLGSRVDEIVANWRRVSNRIYGHYQVAAEAYFEYLKLTSPSSPDPKTESVAPDGSADATASDASSSASKCRADGIGGEGAVTATLRLLRLLVKHAGELRVELEAGLAKTPTMPWRSIVPQLFSRLNHPESYVRRSITELLCRIAADTPHLIVYPAVVGSQTMLSSSTGSSSNGGAGDGDSTSGAGRLLGWVV